MHHCIVTVPAASAAAMLYARAAASSVRPGLYRLLALSPALGLLLVLPLAVPAYSARGAAAFFLVWLGEFKLLLLASGRGPLDPGLGPLPFVFTGVLPVKLLHKKADDLANKTEQAGAPPLLYSGSVKLAAMLAIVYALRDKDRMHRYAAFTLYALITYCVLDFALPCLAAMGGALGEFWGRRWNLMASAVLRAAVYLPVRARLGSAAAGVFAAFLASGIMHEVIVWYIAFRAPTGTVTAFFALHGASVCAERWCGARPLQRAVAAPLVLAYVASTAFWLLFPPLFGAGTDDHFIAETNALPSAVTDAGGRLLRLRLG